MAQQPLLDFTSTGEIFIRTSEQIRKSISSRVKNELRPEMQAYMIEVQGEIEDSTANGEPTKRTPKERAGLILAVFRNEHMSPSVLLVRQCLERAVICQKEIDELLFIWHNLQEDPDFIYKLNIEQVTRYGMVPLEVEARG